MRLATAIAKARKASAFKPDARGLMPLAKARGVLAKNRILNQRQPLAPVQWAALLSLKDAKEASAMLFALTWDGWLGADYQARTFAERYGSTALLSFFVGCLGLGGMFDAPFDDALEALGNDGSELAFEIGLRTSNTHHPLMFKAKRQTLATAPRQSYDPREKVDQWLLAFAKKHPDVAKAVVTRRVAAKDKRAKAFAKLLWPAPEKAFTPAEFEKQILATFDKAAAAAEWPPFSSGIEDDPAAWEYFELRMLAVRSKTTDDWGVVFERLSGSYDRYEPTHVKRYLYGSRIKSAGWNDGHDVVAKFRTERVPDAANGETLGLDIDGVTVTGPKGALVLDSKKLAKRNLKPTFATEIDGDAGFNLRLRAYIDVHPGVFFTPAAKLVKLLGIADAMIICDTTAFAHAVGKTRPSKSATYKTLAQAIVTRDPRAFVPGKSNLDFRIHAVNAIS